MKESAFRELHDSVIQEMLNIDVELRLLKYKFQDETVVESTQQIEGLVSQLIDDIHVYQWNYVLRH